MATYKLNCESKKSVINIVAGEDVPANVKYIQRGDFYFKRSEVVIAATNQPDPYEWIELERQERLEDNALIVDAKDLIATTKKLKTSAQQRGLNVREEVDTLAAEMLSENEALKARIAELEAAAQPAVE